MRTRYDLSVTRFICDRPTCHTVIDVPSETLYEGEVWCPRCDSEAWAKYVGTAATQLPDKLQLPKQFHLLPVPRLEPSDDLRSANLLFRPYSQRSFLRQYIEWLKLGRLEHICDFQPSATCFKRYDTERQCYTDEIDYELVDECNGRACQFLRTETVKPIRDDELWCVALKNLCSVGKPESFCDTNDEAQLLRNFLLLTGGDHFPMLIPQASILSGQKRPDFLCFVPITAFQYQPTAILVDRPAKPSTALDNETKEYENLGYTVKRILVERDHGFSYFKAARELKNWLASP